MTSPVYYSAYRGPVWDSNGQFHHFARQCDPTHTKNGYWRFCTHADDQRAYEYGLTTPEAVLIAQDVCDGVYDGIMLRWVPGELDADNKPTVGTAAAHLETIYNERRVLGKPLSFRGRVPLYPISTDQRLINFRLMRYGIQKGVISEEAPAASTQPALSNAEASLRVSRADLSSSKHAAAVSASTATRAQVGTSPSSGLQVKHLQHTDNAHPTPHTAGSCTQSASPHIDSPNDEATASSTTRSARSSTICKPLFSRSKSPVPARSPMGSAKTSQTTPQCNMADYASTHCAGSSTLTSPQAGTKPTSLPRSITTPVSLTTNSAYSSPPGLERRSVPPNSTGGTLLAQDLEAPPLDPRLRGRTRLRLSNTLTQSNAHKSYELSVSTESGAGELILTEDDETRIIMHDSNGSADQSNDDLITLQCMDLTPSQLYDAQSATLPCMSCEMIGSHQPQCWIQEAESCLKPTEKLTETDYHSLVTQVKHFDPGPWTTHVGSPPEGPTEDPNTQIEGMAELIRSLSETAGVPEIGRLDDRLTVLLWVLRSSDNMQVVVNLHSDCSSGGLDQNDLEMATAWY